MNERPHGRVKYVVEKCRCETCTADNRIYVNDVNRLKAYGRWEPYVDAIPVRDHLLALRDAGIGWKRAAELAGVAHGAVEKILYGAKYRGMGPSKRVRPETAEKILAVRLDTEPLDRYGIDATGTHRRLQALVALGWSQSKLGARIAMSPGNFHKMMNQARVRMGTARTVKALYEELWNQPPPEQLHRDKIAASRARGVAHRNGWVLPIEWDDDTIDDPTNGPATVDVQLDEVDEVAVERAVEGEPVGLNLAERREAARRLAAAGDGPHRIARLLRCSPRQIQKLLEAS